MATMMVRSTRNDTRVVLWERDEAHPNGEAMVFGAEPVEVGDTQQVRMRMAEGVIEQVRETRKAPAKDA